MSPAKLQLLLQEAVTHHRAGRLGEAEKCYARVRASAPLNFDALHLSGMLALQQTGRARDAFDLLRKALRINPGSAVCEMRLGVACAALGDYAAAEKHHRAALTREPTMPEAWCHLGTALRAQGQPAAARAAYVHAIALRQNYFEAHDRLGALVSEIDGFAAAVPHFRQAAELQPENATALANLGVALAQSGASSAALGMLDRALRLDPGHELALTGRALVLQETHRIEEAIAAYGQVLAKNPHHHEARSGRLLSLHYQSGLTRERIFAEHQAFGATLPETGPRAFPNAPEPDRRLRVGFLSADLRGHSVAYFLAPLLAYLDRESFEVYLYHDHPRVDAMSETLRGYAKVWRHVAGLPHDLLERMIREDTPDILIDLGGHTGLNRLPLFARRLAPVQATYLGYPDTTGLPAMDFRFIDPVTDPVGEADAFAAERLVRFSSTAWAYAPSGEAPPVAPPPCLAGGAVTFGCFNNFAKVSDETLLGWAKVLAAVPDSRLLVKGHGLADPTLAAPLQRRLDLLGVGPERIETLGRTPGIAAHLGMYSRVDIALDTFPYHGTTTTCEALWMGRPVITLAGDRHAARVGASLLGAVGHPEWVAADWDDYTRIAAGLGRDPARLAGISAGLQADVQASALFDHAGQAERFGSALRECWAAWCGQLAATA